MVRAWPWLLALGCAPKEPGWSSASEHGDSAATTGGSATTGGTTIGGSASTGEVVRECELPGTPAARDRPIRLRNLADHPIWLVGVHSVFPFALEGPAGSITTSIYGWCDGCSTVLDRGCEPWCEDHADQIAIRVEPGGIFEKVWSGRLWQTITLACEGCQAQCDVASIAAPGDYVARADVWGSCVADPRASPWLAGCDCTPDENGACELFLPVATFEGEVALETPFAWPGTQPVELVYE